MNVPGLYKMMRILIVLCVITPGWATKSIYVMGDTVYRIEYDPIVVGDLEKLLVRNCSAVILTGTPNAVFLEANPIWCRRDHARDSAADVYISINSTAPPEAEYRKCMFNSIGERCTAMERASRIWGITLTALLGALGVVVLGIMCVVCYRECMQICIYKRWRRDTEMMCEGVPDVAQAAGDAC